MGTRSASVILLVSLVCFALAPACAGVYGVRISDLGYTPIPPNPIRVWGKVTNESPLRISDGRAEIAVTGRAAALGEFMVLDGWWNGQFFSVTPIEMIYIPAGSFLMGNNGAEPYSDSAELPQHSVYLSGYWIGKYEVTRGEYAQFMAAGGYSNPAYWSSAGWSWRLTASSSYPSVGPPRTQPCYWGAVQDWGSGSFTQTDSHPVVGVHYYEAEAFCNWAGGHLATEAQWEKAARWTGSYPNVYPWGNVWDAEKCNNPYDHNAAGGGYEKAQTAPVGSYPSGVSPYGLHDMAGNVTEWCRDWFQGDYYSQTPPGGWVDPQGPSSGSSWVKRGGSWFFNGYTSRCADRAGSPGGGWDYRYGLRLAR